MSLAEPSGFVRDFTTVAGRALRSIPREPEAIMPSLIIPIFWYVINIGTLQDIAPSGVDFKSFQIATAIIFAVSGVSRANTVVTDIQSGYLDKMLVTPIRRAALLLGMMAADVVLVVVLATLVVVMGFILGVGFTTGIAGFLTFIAIAAAWGLAFTGFPYFVALKTGNPAAVNSTFLIFFPVRVPHQHLPAPRRPVVLAAERCALQPRHLRPRRAPLPANQRMGRHRTRPSSDRDRHLRCDHLHYVLPSARATRRHRLTGSTPVADIERDEHAGPVPDSAWDADAEARADKGRVEIFNATRPGGLDGWTMDQDQYEAVRELIFEMIDDHADDDGTIRLQTVVDEAQDRYGNHELFPKGRLTNYVRYTKTDMEARCEIERIPRSSPQRITRWRDA